MKKGETKRPARWKKVVLLDDLAPRKEVTGGADRILFGQQVAPPVGPPKPGKR